MIRLKMSWNREGGRLICRWIEFREREKVNHFQPPIRSLKIGA
jgi:hypothetical protein